MVPVQEVMVYTKRFYEIRNLKTDIKEPSNPVRIKDLKGDIKYSDVMFRYSDEKPVLKSISLRISSSKKTAFVGKTGSNSICS